MTGGAWKARGFQLGHRLVPAKSQKVTGTSSWLDKPREGFTAAMLEYTPGMRLSREASYVSGLSYVTDLKPQRFAHD